MTMHCLGKNKHTTWVKLDHFVIKHFQIGRLQKQSFFFRWYFVLGLPVWKPSTEMFLALRLYIAIIKQSQDGNKVLILVRWLKIWVKEFHFFILLSNIFHKYNAMNIYKQ